MYFNAIKSLLQDMRRNNANVDKFEFLYNNVKFEVIILIDRTPFELLFGVIGFNFSFILKLKKGYQLQDLSNEVFFKLCDILNLTPGAKTFTSRMFLEYTAKKIPRQFSMRNIQPHEIAKYKTENIPEKEKIYFCGWKSYTNSKKNAQNFKKTKKWLGDDTYNFCIKHNISSCWTDKDIKKINYYSPKEYVSEIKE